MIVVTCTNCRLALRAIGALEEVSQLVGETSDFWPDRFPCPRCSRNVEGHVESAIDPEELKQFELLDLNAQELFAALMGLGLPKEQICDEGVVKQLLYTTPIRRVGGKMIQNTTRY